MQKSLSKRETQVLKMLLAEYRPIEISRALNLHPNTITGYKNSIMKKWNVTSMVGLVKEGIKQGILELDEEEQIAPNKKKTSNIKIIYTYTER